MLEGVRVLELSAPETMLGARILGDLGAEVVTLEPPAGAAGRRLDPFLDDIPGLERSLLWEALNYNKRGVTLATGRADGRKILGELVKRYDVVFEAIPGGAESQLTGIPLPDSVIHCRVRPFAHVGPKATYKSAEVVMMAAGGAPALAGDPDRPPIFFPSPQGIVEAGAEAAVATLGALMARDRDGDGQVVELTGRIAAMAGAMGRIISGFAGDRPAVRSTIAGGTLAGTATAPSMYECRDGFMLMHIVFGSSFSGMTLNMIRWAIDQGALSADLQDFDWGRYARQAEGPPPPTGPLDALVDAIKELCAVRSKFELVEAARINKFMAAPVMTMEDYSRFPHYQARGHFAHTTVGVEKRPVTAPARFVRLAQDPIEIRRPAPRLSQHTAEIFTTELQLSLPEVQALFVHGVV